MASITVVILTKNEETRIRDCIASVKGWADEIIVVDDESTDRTRDILKELGVTIFVRRMDVEGIHRNWAYAKAKNDWVLSLDADERATEGLKTEIESAISNAAGCAAFTIPRKNHIGDYWIKWGGLYPSAQIKLVRKNNFKWEEVEVHPRAFVDGTCRHLKNDIIHYTYRDWADFLKKMNSQTTLEATKWYKLSLDDPKKAAYKMNFAHAVWRCLDRFCRTFIGKKGYKDGFVGFMIAYFASLYQMISYAKFWEMKNRKGA